MAQHPAGRPRTRLVAVGVVVVVVAVAAVIGWRSTRPGTGDAASPASVASTPPLTASTPARSTSATSPSATSVRATSVSAGSTSASASGSAPADCSSPTAPMDDPTRLTIDSMKVSSHVMSLGLDESGAAAAPPKNDSQGVAWFDEGPKIGATKGNAVLSIHTYRHGGALGNELRDAKTGLKPGALVKVTDSHGTTVCYTFERQTKVWVKDYDPMSTVLYDYEGSPQAVIVICWDFNQATSAWDSRILFYLKPVAPAA
ncbi:class F sortase [Aestuariimicrobium soli]|uniref:class F sortase n=1 Tax=Aestuariimicrobium soli TaxID=2035834 RepID=UPI003EB6BE46